MSRLNKTFLENGQCYCIFETRQYVFILQHEATKVMQDALEEFGGTPEEVR